MLGGLWEFPSKLLGEKESRQEALRALTTSLKLPEPQRLQPLGTVQHQYTHFTLTLHLFEGVVTEAQPYIPPDITHRWLPLEKSDELPLHRAQQKLIDLLNDPQQNLKL
jgi:A/G-specific adenine glycosylase